MRSSIIWLASSFVGFVGLIGVSGCSGSTIRISANADAGGNVDAGGHAACPSSPTPNAACTNVGLVCEYGMGTDFRCNTIATCESNGQWAVAEADCQPVAMMSCPATLADVPKGMACSPNGADCEYPDGRCACTSPVSGPVQVFPDGGSAPITWTCDTPAADCPTPRPKVGSACSDEGKSCDYGSCRIPGGIAISCTNGVWVEEPTECPL